VSSLRIPAELRRRVPKPVRDVALRLAAARRFDAGLVEVPSERAKRRHLLSLFQARGHATLVEAGTYLGDTVAYFLPYAKRVISVEIDHTLWEGAQRRFAEIDSVEIIMGDAADEIPRIAGTLNEPALIFLDGHHSGAGTGRGEEYEPALGILEQLGTTGVAPGSTIVVDDLRLFGREPSYPSLDALVSTARTTWPQAGIYAGLDSLVVEV
jgi:predicted O-methyltransferase YrrM